MERLCASVKKAKPYVAMISLQFGFAGLHIVSVLSLKGGLNNYVLTVYRHAVAFFFIAPFAFFLERKARPKLTFPVFFKIAILGLLEPVIDQNLYYMGIKDTSATFTSALFNILPAITFVMAIILRMEKVHIKKLPSQAKVLGTVLTVGGAMLMALYKGPILEFIWTRGRGHNEISQAASDHNWVRGTIMLTASCIGWSAFFILQSVTLRSYPAELSLSALICFMGMVEGGVVALVMTHNMVNPWSIGWDARLIAPVYSGIVCSGIAYYVQGVVTKERGPVFVTAFNPLCMVIVAVLGSLILAEELSLGRALGAIVIVIGLYFVIWGKSKEASLDPSQDADIIKGVTDLPVINASKMARDGDGLKLEILAKDTILKN